MVPRQTRPDFQIKQELVRLFDFNSSKHHYSRVKLKILLDEPSNQKPSNQKPSNQKPSNQKPSNQKPENSITDPQCLQRFEVYVSVGGQIPVFLKFGEGGFGAGAECGFGRTFKITEGF